MLFTNSTRPLSICHERPRELSGCSFREQLAGLSEPERASVLLGLIRAEVAAVAGEKAPRLIIAESPWRRLGIYREFATELRGRLAAAAGLRIPATIFFDYPTPTALMGYLRAELLGERTAIALPAAERTAAGDDPIAIVEMACRFPEAWVRRTSCGSSWPGARMQSRHPRRAGVSAFGVSGTNGHIILEQASAAEHPTQAEHSVVPWVVSGRSAAALRDQGDRLCAHLQTHPEMQPVDVGYSLVARTRFDTGRC